MTRKQKRFAGIGIIGSVIGLAVLLVSIALRDEIVFFYDPTEVVSGTKVSPGQNFRIGGLFWMAVSSSKIQKSRLL
jgi:cytochrome c-type biogenesis protein CcmE